MFVVGFLMNPILMAYALLAMAIISEVIGSTFLVKSEGFTKLLPSLAVVVLFSLAFYLLSQVIKVIPLGIAYAIWAGVGIVLTALIGYFVFRQSLDFAAMIGIALIVSGVVVINLFSNSTGHYVRCNKQVHVKRHQNRFAKVSYSMRSVWLLKKA